MNFQTKIYENIKNQEILIDLIKKDISNNKDIVVIKKVFQDNIEGYKYLNININHKIWCLKIEVDEKVNLENKLKHLQKSYNSYNRNLLENSKKSIKRKTCNVCNSVINLKYLKQISCPICKNSFLLSNKHKTDKKNIKLKIKKIENQLTKINTKFIWLIGYQKD